MLIAALLFAPPADTCDSIHALVGGELVEWQGYPQGWDLPEDLTKVARVDFDNGGMWAYYSKSEHARYIWVFTSYEQTGDPDEGDFGAHEFCGPYRVTVPG